MTINDIKTLIEDFYTSNKMEDQLISIQTIENTVQIQWKEMYTFDIQITLNEDGSIKELVDGDEDFAMTFANIEAYIEYLHEMFEV